MSLLTGLPWQAGAATTIELVGDRERFTATDFSNANPRVYKQVTGLTIGETYTVTGNIYTGGSSNPLMYVRVSNSADISADGPYNTPHEQGLIDFFFDATATTHYIGFVQLVGANGEYGEIDDNFSMVGESVPPVDLVATGIDTGAPTVATPALSQSHSLVATGIATAAPTASTATVGQKHTLAATGVQTAAPSIGSPAIAQSHNLNPLTIQTGNPSVQTAAIGQLHQLVATPLLTGAPTVPNAQIGQLSALSAESIAAGQPQLGPVSIGQKHSLSASGLTITPVVSQAVLRQLHLLSTTGISVSPVVGNPTVHQIYNFQTGGITVGPPVVGNPTLHQSHKLNSNGLTFGPFSFGPVTLGVVIPTDDLTATGIATGQPTIGIPALFTGFVSSNPERSEIIVSSKTKRLIVVEINNQ